MTASGSTRNHAERATLDGLRGMAAFAVALMHFSVLAPHAYLAVDLFFVLSGFVLEHAYGARLAAGWSPLTFLRKRIARLYPLYAFSLVLCVAAVGGALLLGRGSGWSAGTLAPAAAAGALMLPLWSPNGFLYPLNFPAWTLLAELAANAVYAGVYRRLSACGLVVWTLASGALLGTLGWRFGSLNGGDIWPTVGLGLARAAFAFPAGVLIRRLAGARTTARPIAGSACFVIGAAALYTFGTGIDSRLYDLATALILWPALIVLASGAEVTGVVRIAAMELGAVSYGAYITAIPFYLILHAILRARGLKTDILPWPQAMAFCIVLFAAALTVRHAVGRVLGPGRVDLGLQMHSGRRR